LLKNIRGRIYTALAPIGRYFDLTSERSDIVYFESNQLYDLNEIVEKTQVLQDNPNDLMKLKISEFIMDKKHPMKFTTDVNKTIRNVEYMSKMLEYLPNEIDRIIIILSNNKHFSDIANILVLFQENEFIKSINPDTKTKCNIYMEYFPEIAKLMNELNKIIEDLEHKFL